MARGDPMTLVVVVDPVTELVIHSVHIFHKDHKKRFDTWFTKEQKDRGHNLDRVLVREGFTTIMNPKDEVPVPVELARSKV